MATVNLGAIKFNWKGAYDNSATYAVDDVVSSGGSSYVCILASQGNAVSNGTYWNLMSSAGTNGTDLTSTLTTQGDILYRDGSGLQRLGKPASNKILQNTSGGVLSYIDAPSGKVKQMVVGTASGMTSSSVTMSGVSAIGDIGTSHISVNITPQSTSNKLVALANAPMGINGNDMGQAGVFFGGVCRGAFTGSGYSSDGSGCGITCFDDIDNTNQISVQFRAIGGWSGSNVNLGSRRGSNATSFDGIYGTLIVMEIEQ
jgi:hypothetical protein